MLIIPLSQKLTFKTFPFMTALLLVVNVFVYLALQLPDARVSARFAEAYVESGVAKDELPVYSAWLADGGKLTRKPPALTLNDPRDVAQGGLAIQHDRAFHRDLPRLMNKTLAPDALQKWETKRVELDAIWRKNFTERYLFVPALSRVETFFTHMFMHGDFGHLFGNMVMLMLIGLLVEPAVGALRTFAIYIIGGLGSVVLDLVFSSGSFIGTLGASGAIAALMGATAVLYGFRKVRFFYHFLFYFDFITLPAIVVLPLWVGNELWQWVHFRHVSNVAYLAHVGGLIAGALLALALRKKAAAQFESSGVPSLEVKEDIAKREARAEDAFKKMQWDAAGREFDQLLTLEPHNINYAKKLYTASRASPASARYHRGATALMQLSAKMGASGQLTETVIAYRKAAQPLPQWRPEDMARYAKQLAKANDVSTAKLLADDLLRVPANAAADLADVLLTVALAFHRQRGDGASEALHYLALLEARFPASEQSVLARRLITA